MEYSRLFWKILLIYAGLIAVAVGVFAVVVVVRLRSVVEQEAETRLVTAAQTLLQSFADKLPQASTPALQLRLKDLGERIDARVTLINDDGTIVGDSEAEPTAMDNHLERPEIQAARTSAQGVGIFRRRSSTLEKPMLYAAVRVGNPDRTTGYVRVAADLVSVDERVWTVQRRVVVVAFALLVAGLIITYLLTSRWIDSLTTLTRAVEAAATGEFQTRIPVHTDDDLSKLMSAFNGMLRNLATRDSDFLTRNRQLKEDSDRLSTVLGSMIEGVIAVDHGQKLLFANKAAQMLLDVPQPAGIGRPIWEVIRNPTIQQVVKDALAGQDRTTVELELPRKHAAVAMLATRLPGNPCPGVVLVLHDVTELRRLENLRREFVSNVSHELKTPLTAIQAYTETLLSGGLHDPEHSRQFVERIQEHGDRLHALILDLLRLARIESSTDVFDVRAVRVAGVVASCLNEHRPVAEAKNVTLIVEPSPEDLSVTADEEGLHTMISNLVDNAVKYTPAGGRISVRWRREQGTAVLEVEDTGPGIPIEHQSRIFERFYRVDQARSRELGGTGLGLSIVKHLTQAFGGLIEVESRSGAGSKFTIRLPVG